MEVVRKVLTTPPQAGHKRARRGRSARGKEKKNMTPAALAFLSAGIGAGLAVLGAGVGIGRLAASAMDGTARQPSAVGDIRTSMIIAAALIEGVALFALVICFLLQAKV